MYRMRKTIISMCLYLISMEWMHTHESPKHNIVYGDNDVGEAAVQLGTSVDAVWPLPEPAIYITYPCRNFAAYRDWPNTGYWVVYPNHVRDGAVYENSTEVRHDMVIRFSP